MHQLRRAVSRPLIAAIAAVTLLVGFAPMAIASQPGPNRKTQRFEVRFMTNMIDHHGMAVMMAQMCRGKAVHPQLRALCRTIETSQRREIAQMRSWLRTWYRTDHAPAMHMSAAEMRRMHGMRGASGSAFEIRFMTMMIPHHAQAIREARTCLDRADHQQLRQLCRNIITTQSAEIRTMRTWLRQWYDHPGDRQGRRGHGPGPARVA